MQYSFKVPGKPQAWMRPKSFFIKNQNRMIKYDPMENKTFKAKVAAYALAADVRPLVGPVALKAAFYLERPKRLMRRSDPQMEIPCDRKPDLSNLVKAIEDGLNGIGYGDDAQIYHLDVLKYYHEKEGSPRVEIVLYGG